MVFGAVALVVLATTREISVTCLGGLGGTEDMCPGADSANEKELGDEMSHDLADTTATENKAIHSLVIHCLGRAGCLLRKGLLCNSE